MSWLLFFIAVGFSLYYRKLYLEAERDVEVWKTSASEWKARASEWKARVNELVNDVMKTK